MYAFLFPHRSLPFSTSRFSSRATSTISPWTSQPWSRGASFSRGTIRGVPDVHAAKHPLLWGTPSCTHHMCRIQRTYWRSPLPPQHYLHHLQWCSSFRRYSTQWHQALSFSETQIAPYYNYARNPAQRRGTERLATSLLRLVTRLDYEEVVLPSQPITWICA